MYREHSYGDMIQISYYNNNFLEDKFLSTGEIKKDLELYEL